MCTIKNYTFFDVFFYKRRINMYNEACHPARPRRYSPLRRIQLVTLFSVLNSEIHKNEPFKHNSIVLK